MEPGNERIDRMTSTEEKDKVERIEHEIDSIREEASETIRKLKSEAKAKGDEIKSKAKEALSKTGDKIKSAVSRSQTAGQKNAEKTTAKRRDIYVGIGLMAAGFLSGLTMIVYGRNSSKKRQITEPGPEELADLLQKSNIEAEERKKNRVLVTPAEYQEEKRAEEMSRLLKQDDLSPHDL